MNESALRAILRDISEEAVPVDLSDQALRNAGRRRAVLIGAGVAAATVLALATAPLALADARQQPAGPVRGGVHTPSPSPTGPVPVPSPTGPVPSPSPTGPVPSPTGPVPSPTGPVPSPTGPVPSPTGPAPTPSPSPPR